jgi:hypothetical protein
MDKKFNKSLNQFSWRLPSRLSEERIVLGVYAIATFAAFLGLLLLHFRPH